MWFKNYLYKGGGGIMYMFEDSICLTLWSPLMYYDGMIEYLNLLKM